MPRNRLEKRRAYYAGLTTAHRCYHCLCYRAEDDLKTHLCPSCRERQNAKHRMKYAKKRALNPPDFARTPDTPFRYGKTRLDNPRSVSLVLDHDTYFWIQACRRNYCLSAAYEPHQVAAVIRRILDLLPEAPGEISTLRGMRLPSEAVSGFRLCFACDAENFARLTAHHKAAGGTFASAVRACICHAAQYAVRLPNEEAKRRLWPGYAELADRAE